MNHVLIILIAILLTCSIDLRSQDQSIYHLSWESEKYVIGSGLVLYGSAFYQFDKRNVLTTEEINALDPWTINSFDRSATDKYNQDAPQWSNYCREVAFLLPVGLMLTGSGKKEWKNISYMYLETLFVTTALTSFTKSTIKRIRPFVYNAQVPIERKLTKDATLSFYSGHTAHVASLSFFSAAVLDDLYPNSNKKWIWWSAAVGLPAATAYLRYESGRHYLSDIITGSIIGAAVGYLIPHLHKTNSDKATLSLNTNFNSLLLHGIFTF